MKTSFMGIAALNIGGFTMHSFLDVPTEISRNTGTTKRIIPWNTDCLQEFKQMYDIKHLSVLIIDEISMVKPWMFAYLDERFKEARYTRQTFWRSRSHHVRRLCSAATRWGFIPTTLGHYTPRKRIPTKTWHLLHKAVLARQS